MSALTMTSSAAGRVGQLIRLLGSDKAGEIVAASHAIKRTLGAAGLDLHDFASMAERALTPPPKVIVHEDDNAGLIIRFCFRRVHELDDREAQFVRDLDRLARRLGPKLRLSERQASWLHNIFEHLRGVR